LRHCADRQLHESPDCLRIRGMHDYMDVIACNSVPVHRHTISLRRDSKPLPVGIPFLHELQEKTTIMTAVCEMIGVPLNQRS
jgi:hypothetical protein